MDNFYYYSDECARDDLPVRCRLVRYLNVDGMKHKAAVIEAEHPVYDCQESMFIALPKNAEDLIDQLIEGKSIRINLMRYDERAGEAMLDLSNGLKGVQDWGTLTLSKELAEKWQLR